MVLSAILENVEIKNISNVIAIEMENRNLFPITDFNRLIQFGDTQDNLVSNGKKLIEHIKTLHIPKYNIAQVLSEHQLFKIYKHEIVNNGIIEVDLLSEIIATIAVNNSVRTIDEYINKIDDISISQSLGLEEHKDSRLFNMTAENIDICSHGIKIDKQLVYPHQFLRRHYGSNFTDTIKLLSSCIKNGNKVYIRLDPFRKTLSDNYQEVLELDQWHGSNFLSDKLKEEKTNSTYVSSYNDHNECDHITVFKASNIHDNYRQWTIEEFTPNNKKLPNFGNNACIQKFAHFILDKSSDLICHLDAAIRIFSIDEYEEIYKKIKSGKHNHGHIGKRHKLFLVEGEVTIEKSLELIYSWFRANTCLEEYFCKS